MKRIATALFVALSYANAESLGQWQLHSLRSRLPTQEPTTKTCSEAHCSEIGSVLADTCTKNKWNEGHVVVLYNLHDKETCYCSCSAKKSFVPNSAFKQFLPDDEAEARAKEVDMFRSKSDEKSKQWAQDLLAYHNNFFPEVTFHLKWEDDTVNAYAWVEGGKRHVAILGGLVRYKTINVEGLALVVAHELGHHYAGEPTFPGGLSCEGQADYGGVRDLMRKVWFGEQYIDVARKGTAQMAGLFQVPDDPTIPGGKSNCQHPPGKCRIATYYTAMSLEHVKPECSI